MRLPKPSAPFSPVCVVGESITVDTAGKVLVLPTGNPTILPSFNEYTLNSNRLTVTESPFGGLKGSGSPDYCPGTLNIISGDGIYLTDINGQNTTKTLTAGKLAELGHLMVDTTAHTITEEFILRNDGEGTDVRMIDDCDSADGWGFNNGSGTISATNGILSVTGTSATYGAFAVTKYIGSFFCTGKQFIIVKMRSSVTGTIYINLLSNDLTIIKRFRGSRFPISANIWYSIVIPINAPVGTTGSLAESLVGTFNKNSIDKIVIGVENVGDSTSTIIDIDNITACNGTWAQVEVAVPDFVPLNPGGVVSEDGYKWELKSYNPQSSAFDQAIDFNTEYNTKARWIHGIKFMDGTTNGNCYGWADNIYASGLISYAMGDRGSNTGLDSSSGGLSVSDPLSITYSSNYGTSKRIGFAILMPPSDNGRTGINQCRLKLVTYYDDENGNLVKDLSGCGNHLNLQCDMIKNTDGITIGTKGLYKNTPTSAAFPTVAPFSMWIEFTPTSFNLNGYNYLIDVSRNGESGWSLTQDYTYIKFKVYLHWTPIFQVSFPTSAVLLNQKHVIIAEWSTDNRVRLYLDGVLKATSSSTLDSITTYNDIKELAFCGSDMLADASLLDGIFHSAGILTATLTDEEKSDVSRIASNATICTYRPTISNMGATTYEFSNSTNASYGLQNQIKPWIALYDPATSEIDFYLFTHRPRNLSFKRNESGQIHELTLYPGNGLLYHGQIHYSDLTRDTDSNDIPDCLEASLEGSLSKFLQSYGMVI